MSGWFGFEDEVDRARVVALVCSFLVFPIMALAALRGRISWLTAVILTAVAAGAASGLHYFIARSLSAVSGSMSLGARKAVPSLGAFKVALARERWDEARAELDSQWTQHPGHLEIVIAQEKLLLDGLKAPAGAVSWLRGSLDRVQGADRSYVYLRLAELHADGELRDHGEAMKWCRRLLGEYPQAHQAQTARALLDQLKAETVH